MTFQARAGIQGRTYQEAVVAHLVRFGWTIVSVGWVEPTARIEVDIVAADRDGQIWWIECKGSWESSTRNGMERTDTTKKAIANAALLSVAVADRPPIMVVTSDEPRNAGACWLAIAQTAGWIDRILKVPVP